jgi:hypothetical protein
MGRDPEEPSRGIPFDRVLEQVEEDECLDQLIQDHFPEGDRCCGQRSASVEEPQEGPHPPVHASLGAGACVRDERAVGLPAGLDGGVA